MAEGEEHDWEIIAQRDPYYGVLSSPAFRSGAITPEARQHFYATGDEDIARLLGWFDQDIAARPSSGRAVDIGCGVGRLTHAIAKIVPAVSGYDVAESMLAIARSEAPPNADFSTTLPPGPFSWINSYIVFQHIPPDEGLKLIDAALNRATPDSSSVSRSPSGAIMQAPGRISFPGCAARWSAALAGRQTATLHA